jgi:DNA-directed RNA polymerase specialized sigma24 family protein
VLHHLADLPVAEVARQLSCSVDAVKTRLVRGRRALLDLLGDTAVGDTAVGDTAADKEMDHA